MEDYTSFAVSLPSGLQAQPTLFLDQHKALPFRQRPNLDIEEQHSPTDQDFFVSPWTSDASVADDDEDEEKDQSRGPVASLEPYTLLAKIQARDRIYSTWLVYAIAGIWNQKHNNKPTDNESRHLQRFFSICCGEWDSVWESVLAQMPSIHERPDPAPDSESLNEKLEPLFRLWALITVDQPTERQIESAMWLCKESRETVLHYIALCRKPTLVSPVNSANSPMSRNSRHKELSRSSSHKDRGRKRHEKSVRDSRANKSFRPRRNSRSKDSPPKFNLHLVTAPEHSQSGRSLKPTEKYGFHLIAEPKHDSSDRSTTVPKKRVLHLVPAPEETRRLSPTSKYGVSLLEALQSEEPKRKARRYF